MRVIAGVARRVKLLSASEEISRPTTDRVKEALFSSIHFSLPDACVLDLFGGSGALGIEALSRGAKSCTFVESNRAAHEIIVKNLKECGLFSQARVIFADALDFIKNNKDLYDLVFVDPPYQSGLYVQVMDELQNHLQVGKKVIVESNQCAGTYEGFTLQKDARYGKIHIGIYERCK